MKRLGLCIGMIALLLTACADTLPPEVTPTADETPFVRAVWVPFMEVEELLASGDAEVCREAIAACMEDCAVRGVNTVFFHVRANSDAYYASEYYPPDESAAALLQQGFDPLTCAIEEAHARSIALHAWINPYRIGTDATRAQTDGMFAFSGKCYYIPSDSETQALVVNGVREIVERYAVDGVQFDDYFYPDGAVSAQTPADFEQEAFTAYREGGGALSVGDWRRLQVSSLIAKVYDVCHSRDGCLFGVSPAYDIDHNRDSLYADVEEWARTPGYVDYLCPQLYFGFEHQYAPFLTILDAWDALARCETVSLYAGLGLYKTGLSEDPYAGSGRAEWQSGGDMIARQAQAVYAAEWQGIALYSHQSFIAGDSRDAAVVSAECDAISDTWRAFTVQR